MAPTGSSGDAEHKKEENCSCFRKNENETELDTKMKNGNYMKKIGPGKEMDRRSSEKRLGIYVKM